MSERAAYWREVLSECEQSGLTRVEFCRRRGINAGTLAWWKRQFKRMDKRGRRPAGRGPRAAARLPAFVELATRTDPGDGALWRAWPAGGSEARGSGGRQPAGSYAVVLPNGVELRLGDDFDAAQVARLVQALGAVGGAGQWATSGRVPLC